MMMPFTAWLQMLITPDSANIPIIGNGMCELEDAAAALEWAPKDHTFSNVVELLLAMVAQ
jgi:hypothetical protein